MTIEKSLAPDAEAPSARPAKGAGATHELHRGLELHFFAHLGLAEDADQSLVQYGLGRTHHRVLYFVAQSPGITVGEMLSILRVTHQNVQRPMGELLRKKLIEQRTSMTDRRQRQLYITPDGQALLDDLTARQFERIARAYELAGPEAVEGYWAVLWHMIDEGDRAWLERTRPARET